MRLRIILSIAIVGLLLNSSHATWAANYRVKKVRVKELPYETQVIITADKEIKYVLFIPSNPPRIVIDISKKAYQRQKLAKARKITEAKRAEEKQKARELARKKKAATAKARKIRKERTKKEKAKEKAVEEQLKVREKAKRKEEKELTKQRREEKRIRREEEVEAKRKEKLRIRQEAKEKKLEEKAKEVVEKRAGKEEALREKEARKRESERVRKWESEIKKREKELARQKKAATAKAQKETEKRKREEAEARKERERRIGGYYAAGRHLYKEGKYQEAIRELEKTLSLSPEHKGAKKYLVKCQRRVEEKPIEKEEVVVQKLPEEKVEAPKKVIYKYKEYLIGPGDVLEVFVWRQDDLTMEVAVDAQGKISFPIVGEIEVGGATTKEIGQKISQGLSRYIRNPWVKVSVKEYYGYKVYVLGEVEEPGRYEMERGQRLVEGLAQAEGWTDDAVLRSVVIIRGGFEQPQVLLVNVNQILKGDLKRNIELQAQDIIYVPRRFIADVNYVLNQILPTLRTIVLTDSAVGVLER